MKIFLIHLYLDPVIQIVTHAGVVFDIWSVYIMTYDAWKVKQFEIHITFQSKWMNEWMIFEKDKDKDKFAGT